MKGEINHSIEKTTFLHVSPVLASSDVARDIAWWDQIGFKNVYNSAQYQVGPLDYAVIRREDLVIHLQMQFEKDMISTDVKIEVKNIEPLIDYFIQKKMLNSEAVQRKTPWNTTEFTVFDPSGNRITFLEDL